MRILLITHFFPPGHIGGTEALTLALAQSLQTNQHEVQVLCAENWDQAPDYKINATDDSYQDIPVKRLHFNWKKAPDVFGFLYHNPEVEAYLDRFLEEYRPDLVHITSCYSLSTSVITAAHRAGLPIVLTATDFWFLCANNTLLHSDGSLCSGPGEALKCAKCKLADAKLYRWPRKFLPNSVVEPLLLEVGKSPFLTRQRGIRGMHGDWEQRLAVLLDSLEKVDTIVTASQFLKSLYVRYGIPEDKIVHRKYGLDTSWAQSLESTESDDDILRLGFIGQIIPMKGPDILIRAVRGLAPEIPVEVKIYGALDKAPNYGKQIRELAADDPRIAFCGTFAYDEIGHVLAEIDVLVVPSIWYDFPLVIPSAFATKTPVIATNLDGMDELITDEVDGLLFERHDAYDLGQKILRLIQEPHLLPGLQAGINPVKTVEVMTEEYEMIYSDLQTGI